MDHDSAPDLISDLPSNIIESILMRMPLRDAVRTSILSSKWRYKWVSLPELVFDEHCVSPSSKDRLTIESKLIKFIDRVLLLHIGPIHMFKISTLYLRCCPDIDQWILFLSRNNVREFILELEEDEWFSMPSSLFSCQKLCNLELFRCELIPPPTFKGFPCLKSLNLQQVCLAPDRIEDLISSCPLLEMLTLSYLDCLSLKICAPNLKHLCLEGEFKDICIENTPLLATLYVATYMTDEIAEHFELSKSSNFFKVLGQLPCLERLVGHSYFAKFLSIGNVPRRLDITYNHLKNIELFQVSFEDAKEVLVVLRLLANAPNLQHLTISGSSSIEDAMEAPDLDFWETQDTSECSLRRLQTVKFKDMSGVPHELEFIKFLLRNSPVLETMSIAPCLFLVEGRWNMLIELLRFRRASALAEIIYSQE